MAGCAPGLPVGCAGQAGPECGSEHGEAHGAVGPTGRGDMYGESEDLGNPGQRPDLPGVASRGHRFWEKEESLGCAFPPGEVLGIALSLAGLGWGAWRGWRESQPILCSLE